jgi:hypothetical protein
MQDLIKLSVNLLISETDWMEYLMKYSNSWNHFSVKMINLKNKLELEAKIESLKLLLIIRIQQKDTKDKFKI